MNFSSNKYVQIWDKYDFSVNDRSLDIKALLMNFSSNKYVQIWDKYDSPLMTVHWTLIMRTKHFSFGGKIYNHQNQMAPFFKTKWLKKSRHIHTKAGTKIVPAFASIKYPINAFRIALKVHLF